MKVVAGMAIVSSCAKTTAQRNSLASTNTLNAKGRSSRLDETGHRRVSLQMGLPYRATAGMLTEFERDVQ